MSELENTLIQRALPSQIESASHPTVLHPKKKPSGLLKALISKQG